MIFGHDFSFWVAVFGAILVKLVTSESHSIPKVLAAVVTALFAAWAFTNPLLNYLQLPAEDYKVLLAALLALTGEGLVRSLISITSSPDKIIDLWKSLRGGK